MTNLEIAMRLVTLCREHKNFEAMNELYADDIVSVESIAGNNGDFETVGKAAVIQKSADFAAGHEIHSGSMEGPFEGPDKFAVLFDFDVTNKASGRRMRLKEVGVYTVVGGMIVREEFLYAMPQAPMAA